MTYVIPYDEVLRKPTTHTAISEVTVTLQNEPLNIHGQQDTFLYEIGKCPADRRCADDQEESGKPGDCSKSTIS